MGHAAHPMHDPAFGLSGGIPMRVWAPDARCCTSLPMYLAGEGIRSEEGGVPLPLKGGAHRVCVCVCVCVGGVLCRYKRTFARSRQGRLFYGNPPYDDLAKL